MWKKIFKIAGISAVAVGIVGATAVSLIINHYKKEIPNIAELVESYTPSIPT